MHDDDIHDGVVSRIDSGKYDKIETLSTVSPDLKKVEKNLKFSKKILENPLKKGFHLVNVFNAVQFDPAYQVYGDNRWDRSIYVTDELCDIYVGATHEQTQKYLKKKRKVDSKMMFLLLIVGIGGFAMFVMLLLMGFFG